MYSQYCYRRLSSLIDPTFPEKAGSSYENDTRASGRNTVVVGCLFVQYSTSMYSKLYCIHIVHHSADRALSFLFRLSMGHMSAQLMTTVENPVPSPLLQYNSTYSLGTMFSRGSRFILKKILGLIFFKQCLKFQTICREIRILISKKNIIKVLDKNWS